MKIEETKLVQKPWGFERWFAVTDKYVGKFLHISPKEELSKQLHERKLESLYMLEGSAVITIWDDNGKPQRFDFPSGMCYTISPKRVHHIYSENGCKIVEISTPEIEDVVRLSDKYGRIK